jgi:hypothetical protein
MQRAFVDLHQRDLSMARTQPDGAGWLTKGGHHGFEHEIFDELISQDGRSFKRWPISECPEFSGNL